MLKCYICCGDASSCGTICPLCKKVIDINCHGGVIGDGYVICKICAGCSKSSTDEKDDIVGRCFQKMTTEKINEVASSQLLKSIYCSSVYSYRHDFFQAGGQKKSMLALVFLIEVEAFKVYYVLHATLLQYIQILHIDLIKSVTSN
ncbi:uncharacterized protein LOC136091867 [Hydra vulgaris]|uniref:uncharacterized protein LOC136091867 n=1 Tax=Hydra vulgaris TaxID=6087 RepID=UPI0032EA117E